jgi:hypothetical protein
VWKIQNLIKAFKNINFSEIWFLVVGMQKEGLNSTKDKLDISDSKMQMKHDP